MSYTWVGAGINCNYWQGTDKEEVPTPRDGDTFLDVDDSTMWTYLDNEWHQING